MTLTELKKLIKTENDRLEFKTTTSELRRACGTLCAFLNHYGGIAKAVEGSKNENSENNKLGCAINFYIIYQSVAPIHHIHVLYRAFHLILIYSVHLTRSFDLWSTKHNFDFQTDQA